VVGGLRVGLQPPRLSCSQDVTLLYPWSKIQEDAESQKDILGAKNIKQTYETISKGKNWLQGTLRGLKGKGGVCWPVCGRGGDWGRDCRGAVGYRCLTRGVHCVCRDD